MSVSQWMRRSFRPSRATTVAGNLANTLLQTVLFWGFFLAVLPAGIVSCERALGVPAMTWPHQQLMGGVVFALAGTLGLTSGITMALAGRGTPLPMACPHALVVVGPYRYIRNPTAVAGLAQGVGVAAMVGSWSVLAYVFAGGALWQVMVRPHEEADLLSRFGTPYAHYRAAVRCWVPPLRAYRACGC
ncbi:MAG: isoprenylcysteine carboxylmethyltransferase family protein [Phycisphaerales bacterium]